MSAPTWWPVMLDFETRSRADLEAVGGRNYWEHPSTEVVCCVFWADGEFIEWVPGDAPPPYTPVLAAHNAIGFDRFGYKRLGWPEPERWVDTSELARSSGMPGALADLGERMGLAAAGVSWFEAHAVLERVEEEIKARKKARTDKKQKIESFSRNAVLMSLGVDPKYLKDKEGNAFTLSLSNPDVDGNLPELTPEAIARSVAYCRQDVAVMVELWPLIWDFDDLEPEVLRVWRAVNDRGVLLDRGLCRALLEADAHEASRITGLPLEALDGARFYARAEALGALSLFRSKRWPKSRSADMLRRLAAKTTSPELRQLLEDRLDVSGLRHAATFVKWVREAGGETATAQYEDVEPLTRSPIPKVAELARARLAVASIAAGKLRAGLARVSPDGRMRDNVRYYGAHTGRGSGSGMQLQNFPRPDGEPASWDDARVRAECENPRRWNQQEITMLLRACIMAPADRVLVVADYSSIEARATAWAAGDHEAIKVFLDKSKDVYCVAASRICGYEVPKKMPDGGKHPMRQAGKIAELACGYGGGKDALIRMAPGMGIDLGALGIDPQKIVDGWRELHAPIVQLWKDLEYAAKCAIDGNTDADAGPFRFSYVEGDLALILPSGRPIVYRDAELVPGKYGPQVRFLGTKGPEHTYGGKLCENAIQGMCRCLMTDAMVRVDQCEDPRLWIVLTVHDEIAAEAERKRAEEALHALESRMTTLPGWAPDFPIACEGFTCNRYRK